MVAQPGFFFTFRVTFPEFVGNDIQQICLGPSNRAIALLKVVVY
jgi:hypothetical protein